MLTWLKHILGIEESPYWSSDWRRHGRTNQAKIVDETQQGIAVLRRRCDVYKHVETGETRIGNCGGSRREWYWFDQKETWPDVVREAYDDTEVIEL